MAGMNEIEIARYERHRFAGLQSGANLVGERVKGEPLTRHLVRSFRHYAPRAPSRLSIAQRSAIVLYLSRLPGRKSSPVYHLDQNRRKRSRRLGRTYRSEGAVFGPQEGI